MNSNCKNWREVSMLYRFFRPLAALFTAAWLLIVPAMTAPAAGPVLPVPELTVHHIGPGPGPTLLIVGGIQGDEPGGFSAATLLVTNYSVQHGNLWVIPNTNFPSILLRAREACGDMNRKFAFISPKDPDFAAIRRLQGLIVDPEVRAVLNLHDGSGFYRPVFENNRCNPRRWGQSVIIDQSVLPGATMPNLEEIAQKVVDDTNCALMAPLHRYHLKNTHTAAGDTEMEKTLTYFAIKHGKPAFGIEASKEFSVELRTYYHLHAIESFMRQMGIEYTRNFPLTPDGVRAALDHDIRVAFEDRIVLPLEDVRPSINYLPFPRDGAVHVSASKPIIAVVGGNERPYSVHYGNNTLTRISPEWREFDYSLDHFLVEVDGEILPVPPGGIVPVTSYFKVLSQPDYRINVIGYQGKESSECDEIVRRKDFIQRFSLDKSGTMFRVEAYKDEMFCGMFLVDFDATVRVAAQPTLPAVDGEENEFGR